MSEKRRRRVLAIIGMLAACVALFVFLLPLIRAEVAWQHIRSRGVLRIGIDVGTRPFSYWDGKDWAGDDAAVAHELARRMHLALEPVNVGYDGLYDSLNTDRVDVSMSALVPDAGRSREAAFSVPYVDVGIRLIGPAVTEFTGAESLANSRVGTVLGSDADTVARYYERRVAGLQLTNVASAEVLIDGLRVGTFDWVLADARRIFGKEASCLPVQASTQTSASRLATSHSTWQCIALEPRPYVLAVRASNRQLLVRVNSALAEMQRDGTLGRIATAWLTTR